MAAVALLIVALLIIFGEPRRRRIAAAPYMLEVSRPLCKRLGRGWTLEKDASAGLTMPAMRIFWAEQLGWIEYRRRPFRDGTWIRLTRRGAREA